MLADVVPCRRWLELTGDPAVVSSEHRVHVAAIRQWQATVGATGRRQRGRKSLTGIPTSRVAVESKQDLAADCASGDISGHSLVHVRRSEDGDGWHPLPCNRERVEDAFAHDEVTAIAESR